MKSRAVKFFYDDDVLIIEERNAFRDIGTVRNRKWITERVALTPKEQQIILAKIAMGPKLAPIEEGTK